MRKRVIYSGFDDELRYTVDYLFEKYDWDPVVLLNVERMRGWAKENYKNALFYEWMQLRNAQFDYSGIGKTAVPVDAKIIGALSKYESLSLDLLEDATGWDFSFHERRQYYYDLLRFWNTVIQHSKPDILVSHTWPHVITEYVLYQLCKYYDIPVLFINPTPLFDHDGKKYFYVNISLEDQSRPFIDIYKSDQSYKISDEIKEYFNSVRSKEGMTPPYIVHFWKNHLKRWDPEFWNKWIKVSKHLMKLFLSGRLLQAHDVALKCNRFSFDSMRSRPNYFQFILYRERVRRNDKRLKKIYSSFVTSPDLNRKYIYYAAAFQPEAGIWNVYQDQFLVLDILTSCIPDDWVIYYKEHPSQFMVGGKGSLARSEDFYKKIASYKNVRMIPSEIKSFPLIDAAQAVGSPSGTVGWESVVRGTPTLMFGNAWYRGCNSVFKIETRQDCMDAIEKIKNGYKPHQSDIERFAAAAQQVCAKNIIHGDYIADQIKACPDPKYEMERTARLFYEAYERNYNEHNACRKTDIISYAASNPKF